MGTKQKDIEASLKGAATSQIWGNLSIKTSDSYGL